MHSLEEIYLNLYVNLSFQGSVLFVFFKKGEGNKKRHYNLTVYLTIGQTVMQYCLLEDLSY